MNTNRFIKLVFALGIVILHVAFTSALTTCPGRPNALENWSSSNVSTCTLAASSSNPFCNFTPSANTSGSQSVAASTSCTATISCGSVSSSDTLTYDPTLVWNGSACVPPPSGTVSGTACTVASASSTCSTTVTWTVSNTSWGTLWDNVSTSARDGSATGGSIIDTLTYGSPRTYSVYNGSTNTGSPLATTTVTPVCASGSAWDGSMCTGSILGVTVNPTTYAAQPGGSVTATYTLTNGNSTNTTCRLLDYQQNPLNTYASCTGSMTGTAPSTTGTFSYYIQAFQSSTGQTAVSNPFTVITGASCPSTPVTWMTNCSATLPVTANGTPATVNNSASGYTGSATYSCTSGTWSSTPTNTSCTAAGSSFIDIFFN